MNIINGKVKPPDGHKIIAEMHFDGDDPRLTTRVVKEDFEIPK